MQLLNFRFIFFVFFLLKSEENDQKTHQNELKICKKVLNFDAFLKNTGFPLEVIENLRRIHHWSLLKRKCLGIPNTEVLLYPFGGGDLVYPLVLFPDIGTIVVIGLEPAGKAIFMKDPYGGIEANLRVLFKMGYFRTKQMERIYSLGVVSLMYRQLVLFKAVDIHMKPLERGFELRFILNGKAKKVIYYCMNLNDKNESYWYSRLSGHKNFTVFLKSSSYVLQQKNFDKIRGFLLLNSKVVFQDDTGLKYSHLLKNRFKIFLYGFYFEPLQSDDFYIFFQPDLMRAYLDTVEDVNVFDISYYEGNWLFAIRP